MRIPVITATDLSEFLESRGSTLKLPTVTMGIEDPNLHEEDIAAFFVLAEGIKDDAILKHPGTQAAFEFFDAQLALQIPSFIDRLDALTVLEPGFWAYLGWKLSETIEWRHPGGQQINFGTNFGNLQESLLGRSYLRGKIGGTEEFISIPGSDLWRSHIIRVKAGNSSPVSKAVLALVRDRNLPVKDVRSIAKLVNAYRSNIIFELLTEEGAKKAIGLIWDEYDKSQSTAS